MKSLESYFSEEDFARFMAMVKAVGIPVDALPGQTILGEEVRYPFG